MTELQNITATVYGHIQQCEYNDAISILEHQLIAFPRSRAALSLLGYCYYHTQSFHQASEYYEQLVRIFPDVEQYRFYHVQSLYKAGLYDEAEQASLLPSTNVANDDRQREQLSVTHAMIRYERGEIDECVRILDQIIVDSDENDIDDTNRLQSLMMLGIVAFKDGNYEQSMERFVHVKDIVGYQPNIVYNIALCHFKLREYDDAIKVVRDIIQNATKDYPELVTTPTESEEVIWIVKNSNLLERNYLVEAYNLIAAIELERNNLIEAQRAMKDLPNREEQDVDPITLHNSALVQAEDDPSASMRKLNFLISQTRSPQEAIGNLLLLQCKHVLYDDAADVMAENASLIARSLTDDTRDYLDAVVVVNINPELAYQKFEAVSTRFMERMRQLKICEADPNESMTKKDMKLILREEVENYLPVLMARAHLYWERENYGETEQLLRHAARFCRDHDIWRTNLAHVCFMREENKLNEAIELYESILNEEKTKKGVLSVPAIVLANLCVAYVRVGRKQSAEEIILEVEEQEDNLISCDPVKSTFHSSIVNLVVGTFYCEKSNFNFGISRVFLSLKPYDRKLNPDSWFLAKKCFLFMAEKIAKNVFAPDDEILHEAIQLMSELSKCGATMAAKLTSVDQVPSSSSEAMDFARLLQFEARELWNLFAAFKS